MIFLGSRKRREYFAVHFMRLMPKPDRDNAEENQRPQGSIAHRDQRESSPQPGRACPRRHGQLNILKPTGTIHVNWLWRGTV